MKRKVLFLAIIALTVAALSAFFMGCGNYTDGYEVGYNIGHADGMKKAQENAGNYSVTFEEAPLGNGSTSFVETVQLLRQQVVDIYATAKTATYAGSGVIIKSDATHSWIITNHHVIEGCYSFEVDVLDIADDEASTEDVTTYEAALVGGSVKDDIAVLRISKGNLHYATWVDNSDKVKVGTEVVAIGNPLGVLGGTVTKGIISATARSIEVDAIGIMSLMQTDAAINSGNSGGGLFSSDGILVGIVNSGYTDYEGLNFAIPANAAKYAAGSIIETYQPGISYGYVEGRNNIGLILDYQTSIYETSSREKKIDIIYAYSIESSGDAAKAGLSKTSIDRSAAAMAITQIVYDSVTYTYSAAKYNNIYNYYLQMSVLLDSVTPGKTVAITCNAVMSGRVGLSTYYYLGSQAIYNVTATQYVYTPPTA